MYRQNGRNMSERADQPFALGGYDILPREGVEFLRPFRTRATLAQLVERLIRNQQVAGSIPAGGSTPN